jgi:ubiquinone/menaquinone biosynthesis C-methylase UbiE
VESDFYSAGITDNVRNVSGVGITADVRELAFKNSVFDLVYSLGVVEHFPETAQAVKEMARVSKNGGYVLITTPRLSLGTLFRYLRACLKS